MSQCAFIIFSYLELAFFVFFLGEKIQFYVYRQIVASPTLIIMSSPIHALDGQILDEEIDNSLFDDLTNSLKDSNLPLSIQRLHSRHSDDLKLILKLILFKLFIWDLYTERLSSLFFTAF